LHVRNSPADDLIERKGSAVVASHLFLGGKKKKRIFAVVRRLGEKGKEGGPEASHLSRGNERGGMWHRANAIQEKKRYE